MLLEAFQYDAFLSGAFQSEVATETGYPAFQADAFQFDAFQVEELVFEEVAKGGLGWLLLFGNPAAKKQESFNTFFLGKPPEKRKEVLREAYEELIEYSPTTVKKQAGKAVRPFNEGDKRRSIPPPSQIDWAAFERDVDRVEMLLELWQEQVLEQDDEEVLMLLTM